MRDEDTGACQCCKHRPPPTVMDRLLFLVFDFFGPAAVLLIVCLIVYGAAEPGFRPIAELLIGGLALLLLWTR